MSRAGWCTWTSQKRPAQIAKGSGRLELAQWLASRDNPLTARVMVNRVWLHLFGRGLVATPDNFGAAGQPPDHPELLDTLAVSFMDHNWSVKELIRQIVLSRAYQLASSHDAKNFEVDPDNTLVWRMSKKRLEAEAIRDAVLSASGRLILEPPVGSAVAQAGEGIAGPNRRFNQDGQDLHRAVYLPVVRDQVPDSLSLFDFADPSLVTGDRASTSGPSQALYLMNNPFIIRQAEAAADRLRASAQGDEARRGRRVPAVSFPEADCGRGLSVSRIPRAIPRRRRPAATASAPPGRPSARPSTRPPSSAISTDRKSTRLTQRGLFR